MTRKTARRLRASACAALALILLSQLLSLPSAPTASASDNAAFCNNSTNRTAFLNNVLSADRSGTSGWDQYLPRLDNTDLLYLCDLDSFYTPPSTLPSGPAGTVMRIRPVYPSIGGPDTFTLKVMYKTENRSGTAVATTGTIISKRVEPASGVDRPLVIWNHGTAGIAPTCVDFAMLGLALYRDYNIRPFITGYDAVVAAPDYIGYGAAQPGGRYQTYVVKDDLAHASIDMAKATHSLNAVTRAGADWALTGHSQGGQASIVASEQDDTYGSSSMNLVASLAVAPPVKLAPLAANPTGSNQMFLWLAALGFKESYSTLDLSQIFKSTALDYIQKLFDNGADAEGMYFLATGSLPPKTPDQLVLEAWWETVDGRDYAWANNLNYAPARKGRPIVACDYNSTIAVVNWIIGQHGYNVYQTNYATSTAWTTLINTILPANSAANEATNGPVAYMMGDCDGLFPITSPALPACGGPTPSGSPPPAFTLRPGYSTSVGFNNFFEMCNAGDEVTGRIYGEVDWNIDGTLDDPAMAEAGSVKHFDHSTIMTEKFDDGIAWLDDAFNNLTSSNCPP